MSQENKASEAADLYYERDEIDSKIKELSAQKKQINEKLSKLVGNDKKEGSKTENFEIPGYVLKLTVTNKIKREADFDALEELNQSLIEEEKSKGKPGSMAIIKTERKLDIKNLKSLYNFCGKETKKILDQAITTKDDTPTLTVKLVEKE